MIPKYIEIQSDEFEDVITYETSDGKIFSKKNEAELYEKKLKFAEIRENSIQYDLPDVFGSWYKVDVEDDLEFLKDYFTTPYDIVKGMDSVKVKEWFCVSVSYGGDSKDTITFITKSDFKASVDDLLNRLI